MRYTKVTAMACVVTIVLLGAAFLFAALRTPDAAPVHGTSSRPVHAGREPYEADCAACHPAAGTLAITMRDGGGWRPVAGLLLTGEARLVTNGRVRVVRRHPTFEESPDERLAAILDYLRALSEEEGAASRAAPVSPEDVRTARPR